MNQAELVIDGYSNLELIEKAQLSVLYRAIQESSGHYVALKTISKFKDSDVIARYNIERSTIEKVKKIEGVVSNIDTGIGSSNTPYFVIPLFNKGSLEDRLVYDGSMAQDEAVDLIIQVSEAVQQAHEIGIAHCDIKPGNIVLTEEGIPKITNFGERLACNSLAPYLDQLISTPAYSAPEVLTDTQGSSEILGDIYSLGATLWALLVGKPPVNIPIGSLAEVSEVISETDLDDISDSGLVSVELWQVLQKALAKKPSSRYQSVEEFIEGLEQSKLNIPEVKDLDKTQAVPIVLDNPIIVSEPNVAPPLITNLTESIDTGSSDQSGLFDFDDTSEEVSYDFNKSGNEAVFVDVEALDNPSEVFEDPKFSFDSEATSINTDLNELRASYSNEDASIDDDVVEVVVAPAKQEKGFPFILVFTVILVTVLACVGAFLLFSDSILGRVIVKDYAGSTIDDVQEDIKTLSLSLVIEEGRKDGTKAGDILSQRPIPGTKLDANGTLTVVVSQGFELQKIPDVIGLEVDDAVGVLEEANLEAGEVVSQVDTSDFAEGEIVELQVEGIKADDEYPTGTTIDFVTSTGLVVVPRVIAEEIQSVLGGELRLVVSTKEEFSDQVEIGEVIRSEPAVGTKVKPGSSIVVYIATEKPKGRVQVPNIDGQTVSNAITILKNKGFEVELREADPGNCRFANGNRRRQCQQYEADLVWGYSPSGEQKFGSTIKIVASEDAIEEAKG